ncbi:DUF4190 domain-containing protein [Cellulomonas rhizosphaerae]|uniref:DUF4190 domain-containing protein n=1 Tax=Cellulomonas rhizosphaerae TaxID=2293719 RepID=A0A413RHD9_9CELL|nr:DUF4190 domain-containing protein [Cellulomonas rhizosphaerae]RHA37559.1 DUF4190 domain-containing protein [Cellulomonas rhizosphaerae]
MAGPTYPPAGPGYGPATGVAYQPPRQPPTSGLAIAAFVVAFFSGLVGLILGIVARRQIRRDGTRGDGFAVAAIAIGTVRLVLEIAVAGYLIAGLATGTVAGESSEEAVASVPATGPFAAGTCAGSDGASEGAGSTVDCSEPHVLEVVGTTAGDVSSAAQECSRQVADIADATPGIPAHRADAIALMVGPDPVACVIIFTDGDVTGSVVDGTLAPAS